MSWITELCSNRTKWGLNGCDLLTLMKYYNQDISYASDGVVLSKVYYDNKVTEMMGWRSETCIGGPLTFYDDSYLLELDKLGKAMEEHANKISVAVIYIYGVALKSYKQLNRTEKYKLRKNYNNNLVNALKQVYNKGVLQGNKKKFDAFISSMDRNPKSRFNRAWNRKFKK